MPLQTKIHYNAPKVGSTTIELAGSLDSTTAADLQNKVDSAVSKTLHSLVFDMKDLKFLSSAGIRVLVSARKVMHGKNGTVAMIHMQPQIEKVFEIVQALPGFSVFSSIQELDAYLTNIQKQFE